MSKLEDAEKADRELRDRLGKVSAALESRRADALDAKARQDRDVIASSDAGRAMSLGFRVIADLIAGIVVGLAIGWGLDRWLGTMPLFLIVFLLLGTAGGVLNVMRTARAPASRGSSRADS
jgi:ATP synthase protein I